MGWPVPKGAGSQGQELSSRTWLAATRAVGVAFSGAAQGAVGARVWSVESGQGVEPPRRSAGVAPRG